MRTLFVELNLPRVLATRALGMVYHGAFFGGMTPLHFEEMSAPRLPGPRWVRCQMRLGGICGSDLHLVYIEGDLRVAPAALPGNRRIYLGHEIAAEVVEVGPGVETVGVGDRVALQKGRWCGSLEIDPPCRHCAVGNYYLCENASQPGPTQIGGGWSDQFVAHETQLFRVPDDLTDAQAMLLEPAAVGVRSALRHPPQPGDQVLVIGCGTIGLMTLQAVRAAQPEVEITAMAKHPHQAGMARQLGADQVINTRDPYREIAAITGARRYRGTFGNQMLLGGLDVVYDSVGTQRTLHDALRWTRAGGAVVLVGVHLEPMKLDLTPVWYQEVDLIGVIAHGMETWDGERVSTFDLAVRWLREGKLNLDGMVTHRFPLERYQEAITAAADKSSQAIKVAFEFPRDQLTIVPAG